MKIFSFIFIFQSNETTPITSDTDSLAENSWLNQNTYTQVPSSVTNHQPVSACNSLPDVADSFFDFDIPNSPAEEGEYARLIDSNDSHPLATHENAPESAYVCASPILTVDNSVAVEHSDSSSTDEPFFDPENSDPEQRSNSFNSEFYDCDDSKKGANASNGDKVKQHQNSNNGFDSSSSSTESLPKSQSTTLSTFTAYTSESNYTLGNDVDMPDFCASEQPTIDTIATNDEIETTTTNNKNANDNDSLPENNVVDIQLDSTHSISSRNDTNQPSTGTVPEIPKYDSTNTKSTLSVEHFTNGHSSDNETDDEEPIPRAEILRRSSSLKTGKTPPGTPGRKKIVRFADVLGLDLADVRTFLDEIPKIPKSAFDELQITHEPEPPISLGQRLDKIIVPLFQQPGVLPHFLDVVQLQNVALESAAVTDPICLTISGIVRVRNLDFHKSVHVRYSLDAWHSYSDLQAEYIQNSCDGFSDKFSFTVFGNSMEIGQRIEIALRFSCKGEQFWDNNHGINYCFQCMPATTLQTTNTVHNDSRNHGIHLHDSWCGTSFY